MGCSRNGLSNLSLYRIREQYVPVFNTPLGPRPVVVLWGNDAMREALEN